jgi:ubiquinone/menaquinone biosynthesis C-methylase UbiE
MSTPPQDAWAGAAAYEKYVGRWSRLVAREFLSWLAVPPGRDWLDVGCGTGALSETILEVGAPRRIKGIDRSEQFIAHARQQVRDARVSFEVGDAQSLPAEKGSHDAAVSGLMLNFVPNPVKAVGEMRAALREGGIAAVYVWDYGGKMEMMSHFWDAAAALDARAVEFVEGSRFPMCKPEPLTSIFNEAGLQDVEARAIDIQTRFKDFDDYWSPFLGGQGPAPTYAMSLSEENRAALRERIHGGLPIAADGSIPLESRAWAVRGVARGVSK